MRLVNDKVFKAVFGTESTKEILAFLLNAILDYPEDRKITELTLLNPSNEASYAEEKTAIMDLKAKDRQGRNYNIEVQIIPPSNYVNRVVFYLSKLMSGQLKAGENYDKLTKTISVSIVSDKNVFDGLEDFHNVFRYKHIEKDYELGDVTELHFIELAKFVKLEPGEWNTKLDKWVNFLKFGEMYQESGRYPDELLKEKEIAMAIEQFGKVSADERLRYHLMDLEKADRDRISDREDAIKEARLKGELEGRLKGELEGKMEGKIEVAAKLIAKNIPVSIIMEATGLSEEEINKLITNN